VVVVDDEARGIARIDQVVVQRGSKTLQRCPGCGTTAIARRRSVSPTYRCSRCKETFDHPKHDEIDVDVYEAHLVDWVPLRGLSRNAVRRTALNKGQTAIRPLDPPKFRDRVSLSPDALGLIG
jgi:tRNA(Ile2) C34 agmatinyltransferase TiaS